MGIGPKGNSLLHKLGKRQAWEMTEQELHDLVIKEQERRSVQRALGRAAKMMASNGQSTKSAKARAAKKANNNSLEGCGLAPAILAKLRASGKPDFQIYLELVAAGLIA
jgi:hypothetical protein